MDKLDRMIRQRLQDMAKREGKTVDQIRADMQEAIDAAWSKPDKTEQERMEQAAVPCKGAIPTPEEFIRHSANMARRQEKD